MSIHQISVFLENRTGQLAEITQLLAKEHVVFAGMVTYLCCW